MLRESSVRSVGQPRLTRNALMFNTCEQRSLGDVSDVLKELTMSRNNILKPNLRTLMHKDTL